jgi:RNA polymerase sigma factor (sigma-70 family)
MNRLAHAPIPMDAAPTADIRAMYEDVITRAMAHAERLVSREQAFEIAHDVALEMIGRPPNMVSGALIYVAVTSRLRNIRRTTERRAALEGAWHEMREGVRPAWSQPGAELEMRELRARVDAVIADMPAAMRDAFVLVREQELTYSEAAARLGVGVGTIHTQLSRANARLRDCVERYRSDAPNPSASRKARHP